MPDRKRTESKFSSSANKALSLHFYYLLPFPDPPCALFSWGKLRPMSYTCYVFLSSHFSRFVPTNKLLVTLSDQPGLSDHLSDHLWPPHRSVLLPLPACHPSWHLNSSTSLTTLPPPRVSLNVVTTILIYLILTWHLQIMFYLILKNSSEIIIIGLHTSGNWA